MGVVQSSTPAREAGNGGASPLIRPMSNEEEKYYVVSETGFGGKLFRTINRYTRKGIEISSLPRETINSEGSIVTTKGKTSPKGDLIKATARPKTSPSYPKTRVAFFRPENPDDFTANVDTSKLPTTINPVDFIQSLLLRRVAETSTEYSALENLNRTIIATSLFPPQNAERFLKRANDRLREGRVIKIGCFVCMNIVLANVNGEPRDQTKESIDNTRLNVPKIANRLKQITTLLEATNLPIELTLIIADTDARDIYGPWLADSPTQVKAKISKFSSNIARLGQQISPLINTRRWSDIETPYKGSYSQDFEYAYSNAETLAGKDILELSIQRRKKYYATKGFTNVTSQLLARWEDAARKNVALYAAQGPIIDREFDCLTIMDLDPLKLGRNQSLLCPDLSIWYPFPG